MYRYNLDNAVTYTPDDLDLFRESPFAVWMERLTLENPDHGIAPDRDGEAPTTVVSSPETIIETLRAEGRQVAAIDPDLDEPAQRDATLVAMRNGADFIANGQLAVGAYATRVALLMRTGGYSSLGDYLYIPCEPELGGRFHSGFRLSFIAHLLNALQEQMPPQMLIIRDGADVIPLQTEDFIHYFLAVQQRFERAMNTFRKHRMPDPSESSHFGRWADCASEVLKQRALRELSRAEEAGEGVEEASEMPSLRVAGGDVAPGNYTDGVVTTADLSAGDQGETTASPRADAGHTLAEQARMLEAGRFDTAAAPGRTPNLARFPRAERAESAPDAEDIPPSPDTPLSRLQTSDVAPAARVEDTLNNSLDEALEHPFAGSPGDNERTSRSSHEPALEPSGRRPVPASVDATLQNLEFIGSNSLWSANVTDVLGGDSPERDAPRAPPPNLRDDDQPVVKGDMQEIEVPLSLPDSEDLLDTYDVLEEPRFLPPELPATESSEQRPSQPEVEKARGGFSGLPGVDLDSAPAPTLAPVREESPREAVPGHPVKPKLPSEPPKRDNGGVRREPQPFDDRLHTSDDFEDL